MGAAYERDYLEKRRVDDMRRALNVFTASPPSRVRAGTLAMLAEVAEELEAISARIVRVWD